MKWTAVLCCRGYKALPHVCWNGTSVGKVLGGASLARQHSCAGPALSQGGREVALQTRPKARRCHRPVAGAVPAAVQLPRRHSGRQLCTSLALPVEGSAEDMAEVGGRHIGAMPGWGEMGPSGWARSKPPPPAMWAVPVQVDLCLLVGRRRSKQPRQAGWGLGKGTNVVRMQPSCTA